MIKEERKKKKRRRAGFYLFLFFVLLVGAGALVVTQVFTVEQVVVEGNELYDSSQIESMILDDDYSWNSLYVYLKYRFKDIGEVPFVDTMEVSLDSPHTVHVKVYEKGMLGYLYISSIGQNAYFDKDGFVVETSKETIAGVPKIMGISCDEVVLYEKLPLENDSVLRKLLNLTQTLKKYDLLPDEIQYDSHMEPVLYYDGIEVQMGSEDNLSQKVVRMSYILPQLSGLYGTLHLETWTPENTDIIWDRGEAPAEEPAEEMTEEPAIEIPEDGGTDTNQDSGTGEEIPRDDGQDGNDIPVEGDGQQ